MRRLTTSIFIFVLSLIPIPLPAQVPEEQPGEGPVAVIADFDSGQPVNNVGKEIEIWLQGDGTDATQNSKMAFVKDDALGKPEGRSLRLDYDVDSPNPAYNGMRTDLNHFDATPFKTINFYVKGDTQKGFTQKLKVELIGPDKHPSPHIFEGITDEWQLITIPLEEFMLIRDRSILEKFVMVFADITSNPKVGTIYIDQVYFGQ